MQDIWLIHETQNGHAADPEPIFEVHHFQADGETWRPESVMPWPEFVGSQNALSSFAMPDTLVYLGLQITEKPDVHAPRIWMALCDSPSRLNYAELKGAHLTVVEQVQTMGKEVLVCGLRESKQSPHVGRLSDVLTLVSQAERQHIEKWHRSKSTNRTLVTPDLALCLSLVIYGKEGWMMSRLAIGLLIAGLVSGGIHLALEGLRQQGQKLTLQHNQWVKESEQTKLRVEKSTDWEWFTQTIKASYPTSHPQNQIENIAVQWDATGSMHLMLKTHQSGASTKSAKQALRLPKDCINGRQGWIVCTNNSTDLQDNNRD